MSLIQKAVCVRPQLTTDYRNALNRKQNKIRRLATALFLFGAALCLCISPFFPDTSSYVSKKPAENSSGARARADRVDGDVSSRRTQDAHPVDSGHAIGQTGVARPEISYGPIYSRTPEVTPQQEAKSQKGAEDEADVPVRQGRAWPEIPEPSDPPTQPVNIEDLRKSEVTANAPADFRYQQVTDLTPLVSATMSEVNEPSVANMGNTVFFTGNWYAARSSDGGQTFSYVNPVTTFTNVNGGFCCDQVTTYAPAQDMLLWALQYKTDGTNNTIRIARALSATGVANNSWISYRFAPQDFGFPSGTYLDFPNLSLSSTFVYVTTNVYSGGGADQDTQGTFTGAVIMRLRLADLVAGGSINYSYFAQSRANTDVGSLRCVQGASTTMYWAGWLTTSQVRIFHWDDSGSTIFWDDVNPAPFTYLKKGEGAATGPDGTNFAARADSRILGAWLANGVIGLMWAAKQDSTFPYPYVIVGRFDQTSRARLSQNAIWNAANAWLYPTAAPNAASNLAGLMSFGGGSNNPGTNIWIADDVEAGFSPVALHGATTGTNGPASNKWGDYLTVRAHRDFPNTWVAATYSLKNGNTGANAVPRYIWFGRERDFGGAPTPTATPTPTPTATPTPTPPPTVVAQQLSLETDGPQPDQAAALDSQLSTRDPFLVINNVNLLFQGSDQNTRVAVYLSNFQLMMGELAASVIVGLTDSNHQNFEVPAEDVRPLSNPTLTQVIFRLPTSLATGNCLVQIKAHNQVSNGGLIRIKSPSNAVTLNVVRTGTGSGSVNTNPLAVTCDPYCSATFNSGNSITLTATPTAGSLFTGWSGNGCAGTSPCLVTLNDSRMITANFEFQSFTSVLNGQTSLMTQFPTLGPVTYVTRQSESITEPSAFPGWVSLLVDASTPQSVVVGAITANGGTIIDAIPKIGVYTVSVSPSHESAFLTNMFVNNYVIDGVPSSAIVPADRVAIDYFTVLGACGSHGDRVAAVMGRDGTAVRRIAIENPPILEALRRLLGGEASFEPSALRAVIQQVQNAAANNGQVVINLSQQSLSSKAADGQNIRTFCGQQATAAEPACRRVQVAQRFFLLTLLSAINQLDPAVRNRAIIVVSSGNAGVDLSQELTILQSLVPEAMRRVVIVGASDTSGNIDKDMNFASGGMVFSLGVKVPTVLGPCLADGTSFAAPEVARALDYIWSQNPTLTSDKIVDAFKLALMELQKQNVVPQDGNGLTLQTFLDRAVAIARGQTCGSGSIIISGSVTNRTTGQPVSGASLLVVHNGGAYASLSGSDGSYSLCLPSTLRDQTSSVILQVSASGFVSQGVPVNLNSGNQTVNVALDPNSSNVIVVETSLHHLGDSNFSTPLNAGLQTLTAEGLTFTKSFTVSSTQLPPNYAIASLEIIVNGAEVGDTVVINGVTVANLNNTIAGPQNFSFPFNISLLRSGNNSITISSLPDNIGGFDDFEFSNVRIKLTK